MDEDSVNPDDQNEPRGYIYEWRKIVGKEAVQKVNIAGLVEKQYQNLSVDEAIFWFAGLMSVVMAMSVPIYLGTEVSQCVRFMGASAAATVSAMALALTYERRSIIGKLKKITQNQSGSDVT